MPSETADLPPAQRLSWQCRRGMLELDLLLDGFLRKGYEDLGDEEKRRFIRMLDFEDQLLIDWLMLAVIPSDPDIGRIVTKIRNAV